MVITAVDYIPGEVINIGVFDPWPLSPSKRFLSSAEGRQKEVGGQCTFIGAFSVEDVPEYIARV